MSLKNLPPPLPAVDLNNILLNENAYFYKQTSNFTQEDILKIFRESLTDKQAERKYKTLIRQPLSDGQKTVARYSLDIFSFKSKPTFLENPEQGKNEIKYGLFLILESNGYIAVIRKNVSGIKSFYKKINNIDYKVLAHFLITNKSKFEKIVSNSMNTASNAFQTKSTEGIDLKKILSRFGASKQIINSIRLDNDGGKNTVVLNTSRVNSFNLKSKFEIVLFWIVATIRLIDRAYQNLPASAFIDGFAEPLKFEDVIDSLVPTYVLLRFGNLKSQIEDGEIEKCYRINEGGKEEKVDLLAVINTNEKLFELSRSNNYLFENDLLQLKVNKTSLTVSSEDFKKIIIDYGDGDKLTLSQYINQESNFIVNFDKVDHVYSHGKVFKDSKLLGDLENFYGTFITYSEIAQITSEKGTSYTTNSTSFDQNSLFSFIETKLAKQSQCLICDDMGVEWGDFISIDHDEITFYHAKYQTEGLSATNLEEIFGQAQKNLGSLELNEDMIDYRKVRWQGKYKIHKVLTNIDRIRICPASLDKISKIKELVNIASSSGNFRRRIYIVINFISLQELKKSITDLKAGKTFVNKGVTLQILWFVNSLLSSAYELNTELRIICSP
jgi:hypothetical protein